MKNSVTIILSVLISLSVDAIDLKKVQELNGAWKFNIGDNIAWAQKNFDDSGWDRMFVPGYWEDDGYVGYDGFAWYRKNFTFKNTGYHKILYLIINSIDDADEVYLNGNKIGCMGSFPPEFQTAYRSTRMYVIPVELLGSNNMLAIRVFDLHRSGGIKGDVKICVDEDESLLDIDLSGKWKFKTGHNKERKYPDYNDSDWKEIQVPKIWEIQGYDGYDGYAWYRKSFKMSADMAEEELVLVLGRIDDIDMVYFNGNLIGTSINKNEKYTWKYNSSSWQKDRAYKIPKDMIRNENVVAVAVYDKEGDGGIYLGPIGIMNENNYNQSVVHQSKKYERIHRNDGNFWEYLLKELFD
jgi:hypothetical protein